jgi:hypothetical protein
MKYLKTYKIYESIENLLKKFYISNDELKDIFQDLIDDGYVYSIQETYLTKNGKRDNTNITDSFYPCILINLKRDTYKNDIRNWDGGIYYEDNSIILETIQQSIGRIKSTLDNENIKVLYSISNINNISIRICGDKEKSLLAIDTNLIKEYIKNLFEKKQGHGLTIDKSNLENIKDVNLKDYHLRFNSNDFETSNDDFILLLSPSNYIIEHLKLNNLLSNKEEINKFIKLIIENIYQKCIELSTDKNGWSLDTSFKTGDFRYNHMMNFGKILYNEIEVISINSLLEDDFSKIIEIPSGSLFKKNKKSEILLYKSDIRIKIN